MKFFDKTLDEIYEIVSDINENIYDQLQTDVYPLLEFSFNGTYAWFGFDETILFTDDDDPREYFEESDAYEDVEITLIREINKKLDRYKKIQL